jgi:hypothetical protein
MVVVPETGEKFVTSSSGVKKKKSSLPPCLTSHYQAHLDKPVRLVAIELMYRGTRRFLSG